MKKLAITVIVLAASLLAWKSHSETHDREIRVTKIELLAEHDPQIDPQACWITATGWQGHSHVEYKAVNWNGSCPEIESIVVNHDGLLVRKGDLAFSSGDASFWSATVQSERVIQ
ncbi:MAG: hypothetical protein WAL52_00145 [Candidatus Sulfotelmatobacter sp.]